MQEDFNDDNEIEKRVSELKSAYTLRSQDPREAMRVKSLQLLCFKLASYQPKVLMMLDKYVNFQSMTGNDGDDMIPLESLEAIMTDFSLIIGAVFMLYDQYVRGEVIKKNNPKATQKFHDYIENILLAQNGDGHLIRESVD
jgi:hypothetical protein